MAVKPTRESAVAHLWEQEDVDRWLENELDLADTDENPVLWGPSSGQFRASGSGDTCPRSITLWNSGLNVPVEPRVKRIFRVGNKIEDAIVEQLKARGLFKEAQQRVWVADKLFTGAYDCIIFKAEKGGRLLGEIKSINDRRFGELPKPVRDPVANGHNLGETHRGYVTQWQIYSLGSEVERGFILFENKNNGDQLVFWLIRDDDLLEEVFTIFREAKLYLDKKMIAPLPPERKPEGRRDSVCRWCKAKYLCLKIGPKTVSVKEVKRIDGQIRGS